MEAGPGGRASYPTRHQATARTSPPGTPVCCASTTICQEGGRASPRRVLRHHRAGEPTPGAATVIAVIIVIVIVVPVAFVSTAQCGRRAHRRPAAANTTSVIINIHIYSTAGLWQQQPPPWVAAAVLTLEKVEEERVSVWRIVWRRGEDLGEEGVGREAGGNSKRGTVVASADEAGPSERPGVGMARLRPD